MRSLSSNTPLYKIVAMSSKQATIALLSITALSSLYYVRSLSIAGVSPRYTLHLYDHCPFCIRVELYLLRENIPYDRVVYGYGEGAGPEKCGYNPTGGPVALLGKKVLPVLQQHGNPLMMSESLEIVSFLQAKHGGLPCRAEPARLTAWKSKFDNVKRALVRPGITMLTHLKDWADKRDVEYATNKYIKSGFDFEGSLKNSDSLKKSMSALLVELDASVLKGGSSAIPVVMEHGAWGMDDLCLIPDLR